MIPPHSEYNGPVGSQQLVAALCEARRRQLLLFSDLEGDQLIGRKEHHLEPPIWEMGHIAWFQELYLLRQLDNRSPIFAAGDGIYDSFNVSYRLRWSHDFPDKKKTLAYAADILKRSIDRIVGRDISPKEASFYELVIAHEEMHTENLAVIRQALEIGHTAPLPSNLQSHECYSDFSPGDVSVAGGVFLLGAHPQTGFVLDNEKWQHPVEIAPFRIGKTPVTNREFIDFLDSGAYASRSLWDKDGWNWRRRLKITGPLYWKKMDGVWHEQRFGAWHIVQPWHPVCHVNLNEAQAYCRFAQRRLPTEAEWEMAAAWNPAEQTKRMYPWGDHLADQTLATMNLGYGGTVDVRAKAAGDSAYGCRQMIGNTWEWTTSKFTPYPGFAVGPYENYSVPYFGKKPVLRGGSWATSPRLIRATWRNFFPKHRRNIFAGFRTCAR